MTKLTAGDVNILLFDACGASGCSFFKSLIASYKLKKLWPDMAQLILEQDVDLSRQRLVEPFYSCTNCWRDSPLKEVTFLCPRCTKKLIKDHQ